MVTAWRRSGRPAPRLRCSSAFFNLPTGAEPASIWRTPSLYSAGSFLAFEPSPSRRELKESSMTDLGSKVAQARLTRRQLAGGAAGLGAAAVAANVPSLGVQQALAQATGGTIKLPLGPSANVDLNPIGIRTLGAFYLQSCIYDGLILSSPSWDEVELALAETWDVSEDGLTYTFNLRQGVKWHD